MNNIKAAENIINEFNLCITEKKEDKLSAYGDVANCLLRITIMYNKFNNLKPCVVFTNISSNEQIIKYA
jgi:hypothetical protein